MHLKQFSESTNGTVHRAQGNKMSTGIYMFKHKTRQQQALNKEE